MMQMGSQADRQRLARQAAAAGLRGPALDFELAVGAMVARDYAAAVRLFESAQAGQPPGGVLATYRALAVGLSGEPARAARLAREGRATGRGDPAAWTWLEQTFAPDRLLR
jgi:hypothetical protein